MAFDASGRPIPVYTPDPKEMSAQHYPQDAMTAQVVLAIQKADAALKATTDISQRMTALEKTIGDRLDAALMDIEVRFNHQMETYFKELNRQYETMLAQHPYHPPKSDA